MDTDVELRHLRYFVAVAEELHFGRAAQRLRLSQPPLSQQIRRLEEILGYSLFVRSSRAVSLTPAGGALLDRARHTLRIVQRDLDETRAVAQGEVGALNIGFVGSAMLSTLPATFRAYRSTYPAVHLRLHESFTSQVMHGLNDGSLDVGILRDSDPAESLHLVPLFSEPYVAILPAAHALATQKSLSPASLRNEPFVYYPRSAGARAFEKPLTIFEQYGFHPQIVQEASHWLSILRLVAAGLGVSVAPACVRQIASAEVVCLSLRQTNIASSVELAQRAGDTRPLVERFTQIAKRHTRR